MTRYLTIALLALASLWTAVPTAAAQATGSPPHGWVRRDRDGELQVQLYLFWSPRCSHCPPALELVDRLQARHRWLRVHKYDIVNYPANLELYRQMAAGLNQVGGQTPAFFYCRRLEIGYRSNAETGQRIERALIRCHDAMQKRKTAPALSGAATNPITKALVLAMTGFQPDAAMADEPDEELAADEELLPAELPAEEESVRVPWWGEVQAADLSLPALTVVLAGCDAFNPCAFFVLMTLLGVLVHGRSRPRMLLIGGTFVFISGLFYFLFMAAWLNLFFVVGHLSAITMIAGLAAVAAALINIKDFFWFREGVTLSIPESAKPGLFRRMTQLTHATGLISMLVGTVVLAAAVNLYELLCTSGFPLVYTRVLTLRELPPATYYLYLVAYNLIYVTPLALIVLAFTLTLGRRKLTEYEGRVLKLLSGALMLALGLMLMIRPEWLSSVGGALATMGGALLLAALVVGVERWHSRPVVTASDSTPLARPGEHSRSESSRCPSPNIPVEPGRR